MSDGVSSASLVKIPAMDGDAWLDPVMVTGVVDASPNARSDPYALMEGIRSRVWCRNGHILLSPLTAAEVVALLVATNTATS